MKKLIAVAFIIAALSAVFLLSQSCSNNKKEEAKSTSDKLHGKLVLTGSSTVGPLASELGKRFEALHSDVRIDVQTGGSGRGITDARQGLADIGKVSRALKDDEHDLLAFIQSRLTALESSSIKATRFQS